MPRRCNHTQGEQDDEPEAPDNAAQAGSRGCGFTPPYSRLQVFVACERKTGVQRGGTARVADQDPSGQVSREAFFRKLPSFARSEERRVGKRVELRGRRSLKKKKS